MTAALVSAAPRQAGPAARELRTDIQGLRALAVSLVVVYHLWPTALTGGFVGVDVFFVISGFLITSHLLRAPAAHRAVDLRRVLGPPDPPAAARLACWSSRVTLVATRLVAARDPVGQHRRAGDPSAALYVQNWRLAGDSVDYLAAENAAIAGAALLVAVGRGAVLPGLAGAAPGRCCLVARPRSGRPASCVVGARPRRRRDGSLACSVLRHRVRPGAAPTSSRRPGSGSWAPAACSRLVLAESTADPRAPGRALVDLGWPGWAGRRWSVAAVTYDRRDAFPGWRALLPVARARWR